MRRAHEELSKSRALWFYLLQLIYFSRFPISKGKGNVYVIHSSVYWSKTGWLKWQKLTSYCLGSSILRSRYQYGQDFVGTFLGARMGAFLLCSYLEAGQRAECPAALSRAPIPLWASAARLEDPILVQPPPQSPASYCHYIRSWVQ